MTFQLAPDAQTYDCRKAFADTLIELARADERIVAVCNDSVGSSNLVGWLLEGVDDAGRAQAMDNLRAVFHEAETPDGVLLGTAAWLISATKR